MLNDADGVAMMMLMVSGGGDEMMMRMMMMMMVMVVVVAVMMMAVVAVVFIPDVLSVLVSIYVMVLSAPLCIGRARGADLSGENLNNNI